MGSGMLKPTMFVARWFSRPIEVFRCEADGCLVTMRDIETHLGHFIKQPVFVMPHEYLMIQLGIIR